MNKLYFGDNLTMLRDHVPDHSVDLIYLDPPFNSNENYNCFFEEKGTTAGAQAEAFRDTWSWAGGAASDAYDEVLSAGGSLALILRSFRAWLGDVPLSAYLSMMSVRVVELRRVLKDSGSVYLHCDPTASHYLKLILDAVFGHTNFLSEIEWKRTGTHSSARRWGPVHDTILMYAADNGQHVWNRPYVPLSGKHLQSHYRKVDAQGRRYEYGELTGAGTRNGRSGAIWRGFNVTNLGRHWTTTVEKLEDLYAAGRIYIPEDGGGWPRLIRYQDESKGRAIGDFWEDIPPLNMRAHERLGYPTQKPMALLKRIIEASSNPGCVVLDPFCGCGTTVETAQKLDRQWIGIDVTHYAVTLIEKRLEEFPLANYDVLGRPETIDGAIELARRDKHQFQWWAAWLLGAQRYQQAKKGPDRGIDADIFFANGPYGYGRIIISVKGGDNVNVGMVHELKSVIEAQDAEMGILILLRQPTSGMEALAGGAGSVKHSAHGRMPRVQIITIEELLEGKTPVLPPLPRSETAKGTRSLKSRRRQASRDQLELLLPFENKDGKATPHAKGVFVDPRFMRSA